MCSASIARGVKLIRSIQRKDGCWYGSWAVCFCYGTWFGIEGLLSAGVPNTDPAIQRACEWLVKTQFNDGGWGESFQSSVTKQYVPPPETGVLPRSQVVNTGWSLLALMAAEYKDRKPIDRGIELLLSRQLESGDWNQELISGVFNGNCMITYTAYRNVFPIWALQRYVKKYHGLAFDITQPAKPLILRACLPYDQLTASANDSSDDTTASAASAKATTPKRGASKRNAKSNY